MYKLCCAPLAFALFMILGCNGDEPFTEVEDQYATLVFELVRGERGIPLEATGASVTVFGGGAFYIKNVDLAPIGEVTRINQFVLRNQDHTVVAHAHRPLEEPFDLVVHELLAGSRVGTTGVEGGGEMNVLMEFEPLELRFTNVPDSVREGDELSLQLEFEGPSGVLSQESYVYSWRENADSRNSDFVFVQWGNRGLLERPLVVPAAEGSGHLLLSGVRAGIIRSAGVEATQESWVIESVSIPYATSD